MEESDGDPSPTLDTVSGLSTCSSPLPPEPFEPRFLVKLPGEVTKDGSVVKYTINSTKVGGLEDGQDYVVEREYADFEWLEHCLLTSVSLHGLIVPPLPPRPPITSEMAEAQSKKQFGKNTQLLLGDDFHRDCRQLEQYLRLLLSHHILGKDPALEHFLTVPQAPPRTKVKKSLLRKITEGIENRKGSHKDCEEFFQKERDWVTKYGTSMKETSEVELCTAIGHLATAFTLSTGGEDDSSKTCLKICTLFSVALEDIRHSLQIVNYNDESTLGDYCNLYARYLEMEKEMLLQRTCLLVDYETANKALDRAKPNKLEAAQQAKLAAEKAFEDCSDVARQEIKRFHRRRVRTFQEHLEKFAESKVRTSRDLYAMLTHSLGRLKTFDIS
ncbi:CERK [Cordylochernes scorpioides]|uniref:CERK n=1 Tax=Cordylochernes scorpioides TaxID=51811 RepID=A0ABY6LGL9_9ARAC|nr:CERK [Cordylochernes scorpioides]